MGLLAILLALTPMAAPPTDLLLEGGQVYVSAGSAPRAVSVLVRDGKILFVGDAAAARGRARSPERVDLAGAFV
ncbi:MAG: amidohydrolase, partial [Thermoanaerobaculia bacterium]|nr:amidohydrolase [Thermoanaerobaculia bacterium]